MEIVIRPRGEGKTRDMVSWALAGAFRTVVVVHEAERRRLLKQYGPAGLQEDRVITWEEFKDRGNPGVVDYAIDNLDLILCGVRYATMTERSPDA